VVHAESLLVTAKNTVSGVAYCGNDFRAREKFGYMQQGNSIERVFVNNDGR
jgi:hypothetical protein